MKYRRDKVTLRTFKGQISVVLILAVVIVLIAALAIVFYKEDESALEKEIVGQVFIPKGGDAIYDFTTSCMRQVGKEAVNYAGDHGGYIYRQFNPNRIAPTTGDAVAFSPDSELVVPYWWHLRSDNKCIGACNFEIQRPTLNSIEKELGIYMQAYLADCIDGYADFVEEGYEFTAEEPQVDATITEDDIIFLLTMPIKFTKEEETIDLEQFAVSLPVKFGQAHELATQLTFMQANNSYLEKFIVNLINMYTGKSADRLPPTSKTDISLQAPVVWVKSDVQSRVTGLMSSYSPLLQVFDTSNFEYVNAPEYVDDKQMFDTVYNRNMLVMTADQQDYSDLEATFTYLPWWPIYFDLPCNGEICTSRNMLSTLSNLPIGVQRYLFAYDVSAPFLVEIYDPNAFDGEGFSFKFFLEANVRNNEPLPAEFDPIVMNKAIDTLFCDADKRNGAELTLTVKDKKTGEPVDAQLMFACGPENCNIGQLYGEGSLLRLPVCVGGTVIIQHENYATSYFNIDSEIGKTKSKEVELTPISKVDIDIKKFKMVKTGSQWVLNTNLVSLSPDEEAVLTLTKKSEVMENDFQAFAFVFGNAFDNKERGHYTDIPLMPGTYQVDITTLMRPQNPLRIPPKERCFKETGCVTIPEESIIFDEGSPFPSGGARFETEITQEMLDKGQLEFRTLSLALNEVPENRREIEDIEALSGLADQSARYKPLLAPR